MKEPMPLAEVERILRDAIEKRIAAGWKIRRDGWGFWITHEGKWCGDVDGRCCPLGAWVIEHQPSTGTYETYDDDLGMDVECVVIGEEEAINNATMNVFGWRSDDWSLFTSGVDGDPEANDADPLYQLGKRLADEYVK